MSFTGNKSSMIRRAHLGIVASAAAALLLAACGAKHGDASQVVAKVNDDEITVHEVNFLLQQQRNLRPDQTDEASRQLLERLIDQQLAVQKAVDAKLDRDPVTLQYLEAARRQILAQRYLESETDKAAKPSDADIQKYYTSNPALFADRKVYSMLRTDVQAPEDKRADIAAHASSAKSAAEFTDWLASQGIKSTSAHVTIAAEGLPMQIVAQVDQLKDGQSISLQQQQGVSVLTVESAQLAPKTQDEARDAITQFLTVEARRSAAGQVTKSLRQGAKIEYEGKFAASAPATGNPVPAAVAPVTPAAPAASDPATASSGIDPATLQKGLGLK